MSIHEEATIRAWAYDAERTYIDDDDQDEDLTIGLLPIDMLLPLIDDISCPKADYILLCLDYHHANILRRGQDYHLLETREALESARQFSSERVREWTQSLERRLSYRAGIGPVSRDQALMIGQHILADLSRPESGEVATVSEDNVAFVIERRFPNPKYWEQLRIDKLSGRFAFSRSTG